MNYHEKSAWVCLLTLLAVYVPYFVFVFQTPEAYVGLFVIAVIFLMVLLSGFHIVIALTTPKVLETHSDPPLDELDKEIDNQATRISSIVSSVVTLFWTMGALVAISYLVISGLADASTDERAISEFTIKASHALLGIHVLFCGFVASNVVYYAMLVIGYRRMS